MRPMTTLPVRALVIEDYADARELYVIVLELAGFDVESAGTGPEGLALARQRPPAVVVLDLGLPGQSGLDVARELRRMATTADAVILMVSGHAGPGYQTLAEDAGCDAALAKPCTPEELVLVVSELLEAKGQSTSSWAVTNHWPGSSDPDLIRDPRDPESNFERLPAAEASRA